MPLSKDKEIPKDKNRISDKHIALVNHYFECGMVQDEAVRRAGYSCPRSYADRLFKHPDVVKEIERRRKRMIKKAELTAEWIIDRLMKKASTPELLAKFIKVTQDGKLDWDFTGASEEELALITELQSETYMEGKGPGANQVKRFKVGSADSKGALDSLMKILGIGREQIDANVRVENALDDKELARRLAFILANGVKEEVDGSSG